MISIIPSILVPTAEELRTRLRLIERHHVPVVQLDVADGTLVPSRTFHDPTFISQLNPTSRFEIHLMTTITPGKLERWRQPWVEKIIVHWEAVAQPQSSLDVIAALGKRAGLALNPSTSVDRARPCLHQLDTLLIMGVNPGWGGQQLLPDTAERIRQARQLFPDGNVEVDGGVKRATIEALAAAGANLLIVGSALAEPNFDATYRQLTTLAHAAFPQPRHR